MFDKHYTTASIWCQVKSAFFEKKVKNDRGFFCFTWIFGGNFPARGGIG